MRLHRPTLMAALLLPLMAAAQSPATPALATPASPVLQAGSVVKDQVASGQSRTYRLNVPAGHVVQGVFDGQGALLDLQNEQGQHLRRLGQADATPQGFMWVASAAQDRLVVRATAPDGRFELSLGTTLAPASAPDAAVLPSPRLRALQQALAASADTAATLDAFWQERQREGTPLVEPVSATESQVTFLWRGARDNVRLFGSPSGNHAPLTKLAGTDVWWTSFRMPNTARLSYRLAPDVPLVQGTPLEQRRVILATAQRDPLNPRSFPNRAMADRLDAFQDSSVLALPQAPPQPWIGQRDGVARGKLQRHRLASAILGQARDVWIYRPAGAPPKAMLLLFDAHAYLEQVPTPTIIDNLMADGLIPPTAVVLLGNPSPQARGVELPPNPAFAAFLDKELMPWVRKQGIKLPPARTVIGGSSYGGLASAYAGLVNPQWFGNVLSLSGSYWWSPPGSMSGWVMRQYATQARRDHLRFYLDAGRYEGTRGGQDGILDTNRHLGDVLRAKGYAVTQVEHDTGHDYLHWQGSLGCGLVALLNPSRFNTLAACQSPAPTKGDTLATMAP